MRRGAALVCTASVVNNCSYKIAKRMLQHMRLQVRENFALERQTKPTALFKRQQPEFAANPCVCMWSKGPLNNISIGALALDQCLHTTRTLPYCASLLTPMVVTKCGILLSIKVADQMTYCISQSGGYKTALMTHSPKPIGQGVTGSSTGIVGFTHPL